MEEFLQETRTWPRDPGDYEIDAPDISGGQQTIHWHPDEKKIKQSAGDMRRLQKKGFRGADGYLTAKGRSKEADRQNRLFNNREGSPNKMSAVDVKSGRAS